VKISLKREAEIFQLAKHAHFSSERIILVHFFGHGVGGGGLTINVVVYLYISLPTIPQTHTYPFNRTTVIAVTINILNKICGKQIIRQKRYISLEVLLKKKNKKSE
jgi:hypothetical protein